MQTPENMIKVSIGIGSGAKAIVGARIETKRPMTLQAPYAVARKMVGKRSFTIRQTRSKAVTTPTQRMRQATATGIPLSPEYTDWKISAPTEPMQVNPQNTIKDFLLSRPCVMKRQINDEMISATARQIEIKQRFRSAYEIQRGTRKKAKEAKDQTTIMMIRLFL